MAIEHAAGSRMPAGIAQSIATAGTQRPVLDVVTAAPQVTAVGTVASAGHEVGQAGPMRRRPASTSRPPPAGRRNAWSPLRFETCLIDPTDDTTYLELRMRDLKSRNQFYGLLPLDTVRHLRDQLTEHLDAAPCAPSGTHPR